MSKRLSPKDVIALTGWSEYKVLKLIKLKRLPAANTSTGKVPRWEIRPQDLEAFLTPGAAPAEPKAAPRMPRRKGRLVDDHVPDEFGSRT